MKKLFQKYMAAETAWVIQHPQAAASMISVLTLVTVVLIAFPLLPAGS